MINRDWGMARSGYKQTFRPVGQNVRFALESRRRHGQYRLADIG